MRWYVQYKTKAAMEISNGSVSRLTFSPECRITLAIYALLYISVSVSSLLLLFVHHSFADKCKTCYAYSRWRFQETNVDMATVLWCIFADEKQFIFLLLSPSEFIVPEFATAPNYAPVNITYVQVFL
jgi:hypothetical protein